MGTKWNYRVVVVTHEGNQEDEDLANDPQENVDYFAIVSVFYDEATDKIVTSSDPSEAIITANSLDNLRPLLHSMMQATEHPVLQTCDLPGHSDYVDPAEREVVTETFYSSGKAQPVDDGTAPLFGAMDESVIEPGTPAGTDPSEQSPKSGEPDFSKASASESDDRQAFATAVAAPDDDVSGNQTDVE